MKAEVLAALQSSIAKWRAVSIGTIVDKGATNCALCQRFLIPNGECDGCPVEQKTGKDHCHGTPYYDFRQQAYGIEDDDGNETWEASTSAARKKAREFEDFLVGLLPEGVKPDPNAEVTDHMPTEIFRPWKEGVNNERGVMYFRLFDEGDGDITLRAVNTVGMEIAGGCILMLSPNRALSLIEGVGENIPIMTDDNGYAEVER